ncbi:MAG: hypothetical protein OZSIB_1103 [Candidatus Ozemobacter sibiricus]|uniref:Uncharacterized protein n=1 Tax=Candidatus Ozemobacter sibiricus TaxID=2268124 RepID=A0A367ZL30_9BACT|nr:MAG: hypothetical protein OZSIB_1103 [Candidatus Ozemobacter sibiricus]
MPIRRVQDFQLRFSPQCRVFFARHLSSGSVSAAFRRPAER